MRTIFSQQDANGVGTRWFSLPFAASSVKPAAASAILWLWICSLVNVVRAWVKRARSKPNRTFKLQGKKGSSHVKCVFGSDWSLWRYTMKIHGSYQMMRESETPSGQLKFIPSSYEPKIGIENGVHFSLAKNPRLDTHHCRHVWIRRHEFRIQILHTPISIVRRWQLKVLPLCSSPTFNVMSFGA